MVFLAQWFRWKKKLRKDRQHSAGRGARMCIVIQVTIRSKASSAHVITIVMTGSIAADVVLAIPTKKTAS